MTEYGSFLAAERRLVILRILVEAPGYAANDSVLQQALARFGFHSSRDQVKTEIAWLTEQGLAAAEGLGAVVVATLTQRGLDVAAGRSVAPGVKKPGPG